MSDSSRYWQGVHDDSWLPSSSRASDWNQQIRDRDYPECRTCGGILGECDCTPRKDAFDKYIAHGLAALATHPDWEFDIDKETAAADTIASVLHAIYRRDPFCDVAEAAHELLERAMRSFVGDYEDMGRSWDESA